MNLNKRSIFYLMLVLAVSTAVGCGKTDVNIANEESSLDASAATTAASDASQEASEAGSAGSDDVPDVSEDDLPKLYEEAKECPNAANFEGEWYVGSHSSVCGDLTISVQSAKGFHFSGFYSYFLNTGEAEGDAFFVSDNVAVYKYTEAEDEYLCFVLSGDSLHVIQKGILGMGMNVSAEGEYSHEEPLYENEDILNESYTESQLTEIKKLIGDDELYEEYFEFGTKIGAVDCKDTETKSGEKCKSIDCVVPTYGMCYQAVLTDDGKIYLKLVVNDICDNLYTNDPGYTGKEVPETVEK